MEERKRYTRIVGLSDERRIPRLGKIHLGTKAETAGGKEYPTKSEHFVVPAEVAAVYGPTPKELDVMLPTEEIDTFFPVAYKSYRSGVLVCTGNGSEAQRLGEGGKVSEVKCPCVLLSEKPFPKCKQMGNLMVVVPRVSMGGIYQIDTSSVHSIIGIQSGVDFARGLFGKVAWVPLTLRLLPREVAPDGQKKTVYVLSLTAAGFDKMRQLRGQLMALRSMVCPDGGSEEPPAALIDAPACELGSAVEEEDQVGDGFVAPPAPDAPPQAAPSTSSLSPDVLEGQARSLGRELGKSERLMNAEISAARKKGALSSVVVRLRAEAEREARQAQGSIA